MKKGGKIFEEKHYKIVAEVLRHTLEMGEDVEAINKVYQEFVWAFKNDNDEFNQYSFYESVWGKLADGIR